MVVDALRAAGLGVDYQPPAERRRRHAGEFSGATLTVLLSVAANLSTEALKTSVRSIVVRLRENNLRSEVIVLEPRDHGSWGSE
jgi:hypothetical protein